MKPTRWPVLLLLAVVGGAAAYALTRSHYADLPSPSRYWPLTLLLLAAIEAYTAYTTNGRLDGRPGTRPIEPIAVARTAALAKATSPVAAVLAGGYLGFLAHVARLGGDQAAADTVTAVLGAVFSLLLVGAALALERVCRARPPDDEDEPPSNPYAAD